MYQDTILSVELFFEMYLRIENDTIYLDCGKDPRYYQRSFAFWQKVILDITQTRNYPVPSSKAIKEFCIRIKESRYGDIMMNKSFSITFDNSGLQFKEKI
jgi:hypothetical protein